MLYRRKLILALLETLNRDVSAKSFQKLLFLFTREQKTERLYDFVPYKYGCFSFQANHDLTMLSKQAYISIEKIPNMDSVYRSLHNTKSIIDLNIFDAQTLRNICTEYGSMSQEDLISYTYRKFPFTAINSVIASSLLTEEELNKVYEQKIRYQSNEHMLFTIGYEGVSLETYLRQLITNGVSLLVDVRKNAFSMKYGFSKATLQKSCEGLGIKYEHVPSLGIVSQLRKELKNQEDYDMLFDLYERTTLRDNWQSVLYVRHLIDKYKRVCLTCYEKDPRQCHRSRVAQALMSLDDVDYNFQPLIM